ncbi:MAG: aconitate hydratase [Deltaproteobacteria bacterium RIFCSPLOWO2_12_FULL_50_11]|nr:MAG: aconitate hydratase [Deltaproteobacteria bacterium RIFCSPLOWO2_12_FULL_50_11]
MPTIETTPEILKKTYQKMEERLGIVRRRLQRPLTFVEKILFGHLDNPEKQELNPGPTPLRGFEGPRPPAGGGAYLQLRPDRIAMQDATAQMAILQFMQAQLKQVAVPTTVHCDHLIRAHQGAKADMEVALKENREVYDFLKNASAKYGIGFWRPGAGIIHQVVLENYAVPGGLMIGTDSHTPNAGGLGMCAAGVGGADAVDVMAGMPWEVLQPKLIGVKLTGELSGWTAPKDIILYVCGKLTVKGGTNRIIEYFGPGTETISGTGKATICNMGAELGATCSTFPYDKKMEAYLRSTRRGKLADIANQNVRLLTADPEVLKNPKKFFDEIIEINLSKLEPHIVGPHTPDLARPVSQMTNDVKHHNYPASLKAALIGSCTNSSYEDICRAADVATQALQHKTKTKIPLMVTPGSDQVFATIQRDGQMEKLEAIGAKVLANACGPCIGQWQRDDIQKGEPNSIITSFNRNFPGRNDANPNTLAFIGSPEIVVAYGLAGRLDFNPLTDSLTTAQGKKWRLSAPKKAPDLPPEGFAEARDGFLPPSDQPDSISVQVAPDSQRLQILAPFTPNDPEDYAKMPLLLKTKGKTTTDHISPAGPWLRYRGHLDKISDNMFTGAINGFSEQRGTTKNLDTGEDNLPVPAVARAYKAAHQRWVVVGDENYGEGSSREHAAMSPRYLGAAAIMVRSFARIHETNLKKQGLLPLTFKNSKDYDKVRQTDEITIHDLDQLAPGQPVRATFHHEDNTEDTLEFTHTFNQEQIGWFKTGSALNYLRQNLK